MGYLKLISMALSGPYSPVQCATGAFVSVVLRLMSPSSESHLKLPKLFERVRVRPPTEMEEDRISFFQAFQIWQCRLKRLCERRGDCLRHVHHANHSGTCSLLTQSPFLHAVARCACVWSRSTRSSNNKGSSRCIYFCRACAPLAQPAF